jgi:hypothetical protein
MSASRADAAGRRRPAHAPLQADSAGHCPFCSSRAILTSRIEAPASQHFGDELNRRSREKASAASTQKSMPLVLASSPAHLFGT